MKLIRSWEMLKNGPNRINSARILSMPKQAAAFQGLRALGIFPDLPMASMLTRMTWEIFSAGSAIFSVFPLVEGKAAAGKEKAMIFRLCLALILMKLFLELKKKLV